MILKYVFQFVTVLLLLEENSKTVVDSASHENNLKKNLQIKYLDKRIQLKLAE